MTLFSLLVALAIERLCKYNDQQHLLLTYCFRKIGKPSFSKTLLLMISAGLILGLLFYLVKNMLFGLLTLLITLLMCWFCLGAGVIRKHYRTYLSKATQGNPHAIETMSDELALIHGLPDEENAQLTELQNTLLWINFRYYLSPILWFIFVGPIALGIYALVRTYQTWLAKQHDPYSRMLSAVDRILFYLDWIPARIVGIAYVILGNSDKVFPVWLASLKDFSTPQYQIVTTLAQLSLCEENNNDPVLMPIAAVTLAKKVTILVIALLSFLTIYGAVI